MSDEAVSAVLAARTGKRQRDKDALRYCHRCSCVVHARSPCPCRAESRKKPAKQEDPELCERIVHLHGQTEYSRQELLATLGTPVVWAKFHGYPWWPAQIVELSMALPVTVPVLKRILTGWQENCVLAVFFGNKREYSWMSLVRDALPVVVAEI